MRRLASIALLVVLAGSLAACGGSETVMPTAEEVVGTVPQATEPEIDVEGDAAAGEGVFASAGCGSCHTLSAAGSTGTVGPSLDEAQPDFERAFVTVKDGRGAMPSFEGQLTEQQIADVAAFVSESAGS